MERVGLMGSLFNSTKEITVAVFFHGKSCDIIQSSIKIGAYPDLCYLAITCNSIIIEIYGDMIRICQRIGTCQQ